MKLLLLLLELIHFPFLIHPLRLKILLGNFFYLLNGVGKLYSLMKSYNVKKFITGDEYLTLYYKDIINKDYIKDFKIEKDKIKKKVEERLGYKINNYIPINSIFQVSDVENWEINFC